MKKASCKNHDSEQLLFNNAFQNVCRFRDIRGQRSAVLAPKIPYYVTDDLNFGINRLKLSRATFLLLTLISNYLQVKRYN